MTDSTVGNCAISSTYQHGCLLSLAECLLGARGRLSCLVTRNPL